MVKFTHALKRFYPDLVPVNVNATSVSDLVKKLDDVYPRISTYIVEENGALRKHVNIFIGDTLISDKVGLGDEVKETDEVYIMQALSGG